MRTSAGEGFVEAAYGAVETSGSWEGATLTWNTSRGDWVLRRRDGIKFVFGMMAPLQAIEDRNGNRITLIREGSISGPITQIRTPHGRAIYLRHDSDHRIIEATDNGGAQRILYSYDSDGRLVKVTDPMGRTTRYAYDSENNMTSVTEARGKVLIANTYGANGRVRRQTIGSKGSYTFNQLPTCSGCEAEGTGGTEIIDPDGHKSYDYFTHWLSIAEVRDPGSSEEWKTYTRDGNGNITRIASSSGGLSYKYDASGNVTSVTRELAAAAPLVTSYRYNEFSEPTSIVDTLGQTTSYTYDGGGNLINATDPTGSRTTHDYDGEGELISVTDPQGSSTTYTYADGEIVDITDPLGEHTEISYDAAGQPVGIRNAEGGLTQLTYDKDNEVVSETDPAGDKTNYTYDADGNVVAVADPRGHTQTATYEAFGRLSSRTNALGDTTTYAYDGLGNLTSITDPDGQTTAYTYDALDQLSEASFGAIGGGLPTSTISYGYNNEGDLTSVDDSRAGDYAMSYDPYHRLVEETSPNGTVGYTYNAASERTSMSIEGKEAAAYTYNSDGQLSTISSPNGEVKFSYDHDGQRTQTDLPDSDTEDYAYDAALRLANITYHNPAEEQIGNLQYTRDALGRVSTVSGSYARTNLPEALSEATYNEANELTSREGHTLTYNDDGDLTKDATSTYTWNDRNQLIDLTQGTKMWSYAYDPFGRRVNKTVNGVETNYLYDGGNVARESSEGDTAELLNGLSADRRYARTISSGTSSYLTDELGSTIALADEAGAPVTEYTYDPFGVTTTAGVSSTNPYEYTGRENDVNGLQDNRARYYNPDTGRFVSQDPLGIGGSGINLYQYSGGDPINEIDPSGEIGVSAHEDEREGEIISEIEGELGEPSSCKRGLGGSGTGFGGIVPPMKGISGEFGTPEFSEVPGPPHGENCNKPAPKGNSPSVPNP